MAGQEAGGLGLPADQLGPASLADHHGPPAWQVEVGDIEGQGLVGSRCGLIQQPPQGLVPQRMVGTEEGDQLVGADGPGSGVGVAAGSSGAKRPGHPGQLAQRPRRPPTRGQAVKTFGLQVCDDTTGTPTNCTSEFGNYPTSPNGTERIRGTSIPYTGYQKGVSFGSGTNKLVTISVNTGGDKVYIYNPNPSAVAYPKLLPSTTANGVLTFKTFQPIVWTVTSPTS